MSDQELTDARRTAAVQAQAGSKARAELERSLAAIGQDLARIETSRSWRLAHGASTLLRRVSGRSSVGAGGPAVARSRVEAAARTLTALPGAALGVHAAPRELPRPPAEPAAARWCADDWPPLSIVVTEIGAAGRASRLLSALAGSTQGYPDIEIVLTGSASGEDVRRFGRSLGAGWRIVDSPSGVPMSWRAAANDGASRAREATILFLGAHLEPRDPRWLFELVRCVSRTGASMVGSAIVDSGGPEPDSSGVAAAARRGTGFREVGAGIELLAYSPEEPQDADLEVAALPPGCLLITREWFERVGCFSPGYRSTLAEVDLALKIRTAGGTVVSSGRSVIGEAADDSPAVSAAVAARELSTLRDKWAPRLRREIWRGRFDPQAAPSMSDTPPRATLATVSGGSGRAATDELATRLTDVGWHTTVFDAGAPGARFAGADMVLSFGFEPDLAGAYKAARIAVLDDGSIPADLAGRRLDDYDAILVEPGSELETALTRQAIKAMPLPQADTGTLADRVFTALRRRAEAASFCIKVGAPTWEAAQHWGDLQYARCLEVELERRGHPCLIQAAEDWHDPRGASFDVALQLRGRGRYRPRAGQLNVLWNISHPDEVTAEECDAFDLVFVASERFAHDLAGRTGTPVKVLDQATADRVFFPDPDPAEAHDLVFVGNSRKVERRILRDLLPTSHDLAVWGRDWEGLPPEKHVVAPHIPLEKVRRVYSSAAIVLNDHWDDMREHGFVSNRIYDALACGALVVSDELPEVTERFGDAVATYKDAADLPGLVDDLLGNPEERRRRAHRGRAIVRAEHTFAHRVDVLLDEVRRAEDSLNLR